MTRKMPPRRPRGGNARPRVFPHDAAAEASVLGGILLRQDTLAVVASIVTPDSFHNPRNRAVFEAMQAVDGRGQPIDVVTLEHELRKAGRLEAIGGVPYLSTLALKVPTPDNAERYAEIVRDTHGIRALMLALSELLEQGYEHPDDLADYQARAMAAVSAAVCSTATTGPRSIRESVRDFARVMDRRYSATDGATGVPTGRADLDRHLAGLQPPDLVVLAARPAMGKTSLALGIAHHAAETGVPVVLFSLEMTHVQLVERLLCAQASITTAALRKGEVSREQLDAITDTLAHLRGLPMAIDDTPALTHQQVHARARRFAMEHRDAPIGLVVVDYIQLMRSPDRHGTREQEIAAITAALKGLAKGLGWPVLALSQLNRTLEARTCKRPRLSDLRESGAIEQDADIVLFLYREVVYDDAADAEHAELIIAKHRNGAPGTLELRFEGKYTRFDDWGPRGFRPRLVD